MSVRADWLLTTHTHPHSSGDALLFFFFVLLPKMAHLELTFSVRLHLSKPDFLPI